MPQQTVLGIDDGVLLTRLVEGDESAFRELVHRHHPMMVRVARLYVPVRVAEEVVQETWEAILKGLEGFEGRSSLQTWMFRILLNRARSRGPRERREQPIAFELEGRCEPAEAFRGPEDPWEGHWVVHPSGWWGHPEDRLLGEEMTSVVESALDGLPEAQSVVVRLRDVQGWSGREVCQLLGLSSANERVLLHRGRTSVRAEIQRYLAEEADR